MRIVVLGATGATGKELVKQALAAGHKVVAYVRRPDVVEQQPGLDIVAGQLEDVEAMTSAFQGSDAVICCVGPKLDLRTIRRVDLMQRSLPSIVTAMKGAGVDRLVLVSAFEVGDTAAKASPLARLIYRATMSGIYGDKARAESALPESGLNWTAVYPRDPQRRSAQQRGHDTATVRGRQGSRSPQGVTRQCRCHPDRPRRRPAPVGRKGSD
jgi:uncharacterized protein YbjT (DUF2867 family)